MILFIQHIDIEGPETLQPFFERNGFTTKTVRVYAGEPLPKGFDEIDAVVSLGGPMNVDETDQYPYLVDELRFIREAVRKNVPFLGICLGSQLLAKACGARVVRSPKEEIGFSGVVLTSEGKHDALFKGLPSSIHVFQWHGDMFEIPAKGQLLAQAPACPHQALKVGVNAYGLQFHIEVTGETIASWAERYFRRDDPPSVKKKNDMMNEYQTEKKRFTEISETIFGNFLDIIRMRTVSTKLKEVV